MGAYLDFPGGGQPLQVVHMSELQKRRKRYLDERAWPMLCAHAVGADEVHFWPTPHKAGELKVSYYPPMEVI